MSHSLGGQRRNIFAPCGRHFKGDIRMVNKLFNTHKQYCEQCKNTDTPSKQYTKDHLITNGFNGLTLSRNGNLTFGNKTLASVDVDGKSMLIETEEKQAVEAVKAIKDLTR